MPVSPWPGDVATLPLAFAQVREDALADLWVVRQIGPGARVALVASGGCTAAALAAEPSVGWLHLVDANPAQVALARLKLALLGSAEPAERLAVLGHAAMPPDRRIESIETLLNRLGLPPDILGPQNLIAQSGPDHAGRYELLFAQLRSAFGDQSVALAELLELNDPAEQARRVEPSTNLGQRLDAAYDDVLALPNLVRLFGEGATRNRVEPFARHFARRTRHVLATLPAATNPYLWQMLRGCYPHTVVTPWLERPIAKALPEITWSVRFMADALAAEPGAFDFVHLSNILDWLSPDEAAATLETAAAATRPGGWVLIRQLNSTLDILASGPQFTWHEDEAAALHAADRSFFYRALHLGRRR